MKAQTQRSPFQTLLAGAAGLIVLVLAIAGVRSYHDLVAVKTREADFQRRITQTDERIEDLERQIELLRDDPATLERHAREDLGLVMPGDVVVLLPPEDKENAARADEGRPASAKPASSPPSPPSSPSSPRR